MSQIHEWDPSQQERIHFMKVVSALELYSKYSLHRLERSENYLSTLSENHQKYLASYKHHLRDIRTCINSNNEVVKLIVRDAASVFHNVKNSMDLMETCPVPDCMDMDKVVIILKQLARDWSDECVTEREASYNPILDEIISEFPPGNSDPSEVHILVPGAGLGRLAYEIAMRGYTCQGNDFSLYMLLASNFVLNRCKGANIHTIYPWVHQYVNNLSSEHQTKAVSFPDVNPADLPPGIQFSMVAGDFLEVYSKDSEWNCVTTCFFIDCANNIVAFVETIYKILKPGGIWINLGPLLYYFSDVPNEDSIEPSYEVLREAIVAIGFQFEKEEHNVRTAYTQNPRSMSRYEYSSVFFVCRKPALEMTVP